MADANLSTAATIEIEERALKLANEIQSQLAIQNKKTSLGRIFTRFDESSDILSNQLVQVTEGLFTLNAPSMSAIFTSSLQSSNSKNYYYEAWNGTATNSEPQFSVAYGHRRGSGSAATGTLNDSPTRAIYSQHRLLLLNPGDTEFTFADGTSSDSIYVINFNRSRTVERVDPGNWQLVLAQLSGSSVANNSHTGSNVKIATDPRFISLIDDSGDVQEQFSTVNGMFSRNSIGAMTLENGVVCNVVSGSLLDGIHNPSAPHYYGLMYPEMGMIVLNGEKLNQSCSFNTVTGSNVAGDNAWKLYTSISGAFSANPISNAFQSRNSQIKTSTHYFVRVKNTAMNFSNNPSFITNIQGSGTGQFLQPTFLNDPQVYITTVGMYNDKQELLAVGKLSKPIRKSFSRESLIKVKLDF